MRDPGRSIRVIIFFGVGAFLLLWIASLGLRKTLTPDEAQRIEAVTPHTSFDGSRAMETLTAIAQSTPEATIALLEKNCGATKITGRGTPHLSALCRGSTPENVVVVTRLYAAPDSPGANARAAGSAVLAELATQFGRSRRGLGVVCVWLLNEPAGDDLQTALRIYTPKVVFVVEGAGDCYLSLGSNPDAPPWLTALVLDAAEDFGTASHFPREGAVLPDRLNLRTWQPLTLYVSDPIMGGSIARHAMLYNTPDDTVEHVCADSLQAVGDVLYHAIQGCDTYLARGR